MAWIDPNTNEVRDDGMRLNDDSVTMRNPKQAGSGLWSCRPQTGPCPNGCNQCFYTRPGAYYCDINKPNIPTPEEVGSDVVRMNSGHDSNLQKDLVLETAAQYKHVFFNTAIPDFDFPAPVVFTANAKEEEPGWCPIVNRWKKNRRLHPKHEKLFDRIMFVRVRVSPTNWKYVEEMVACWTAKDIPVVLTFMAYYSQDPPGLEKGVDAFYLHVESGDLGYVAYTWKKRTLNSYWCPTRGYMVHCLSHMKKYGGRLVTICGTLDNGKCSDCHNCDSYYWQTYKHMVETGIIVS